MLKSFEEVAANLPEEIRKGTNRITKFGSVELILSQFFFNIYYDVTLLFLFIRFGRCIFSYSP